MRSVERCRGHSYNFLLFTKIQYWKYKRYGDTWNNSTLAKLSAPSLLLECPASIERICCLFIQYWTSITSWANFLCWIILKVHFINMASESNTSFSLIYPMLNSQIILSNAPDAKPLGMRGVSTPHIGWGSELVFPNKIDVR